MFEFEVQSWRHVRVRLGRWHFRTWPSLFMLLPRGYTHSTTIWAVEFERNDPDGPHTVQLGAFVDEGDARRCLAALEREGWTGLRLNLIQVHARFEDWRWNR